MDKASETSLNGMSELLGKSIIGLSSIPTMRYANNTIKNTPERKLNRVRNLKKAQSSLSGIP